MTMEELISVRLTGHEARFTLTPDAHTRLQRYLEEARSALHADPDRDDVVGELESAVGDHLVRLGSTPDVPVTVSQMEQVLGTVGPVGSETPHARPVPAPSRGRFWCRIKEGGWFGGICLGIAAYGEFNVDWVRTVVLLLTLATGGVLGLVYLVLLLVLPVVPDVATYERLRDSRT